MRAAYIRIELVPWDAEASHDGAGHARSACGNRRAAANGTKERRQTPRSQARKPMTGDENLCGVSGVGVAVAPTHLNLSCCKTQLGFQWLYSFEKFLLGEILYALGTLG